MREEQMIGFHSKRLLDHAIKDRGYMLRPPWRVKVWRAIRRFLVGRW